MTKKTPRYFYGWNIVGASFLAHLSYAEHQSSMLGLFFKPLQSEFGWSRSALAAVQSIAGLVGALISPIIGPLVDRYGPRVLMPIGAIVVGLAMLGVTRIEAIWQFYLLRGVVVAVGFTFMGALVTDVTINKWFVRQRGRALAIERVANSLSNIVFIPTTILVIAASGWRTMFVIFGVFTWLVVLIPSILLMRRRPEDMGLHPDGVAPDTPEILNRQERGQFGQPALNNEPLWNHREVLSTSSFWLLVFCFAMDSLAFQAINISLAPYIQDLGYNNAMLASVITFRSIIFATSTLFTGFVVEYARRASIRIAPLIVEGFAAFLFLLAGKPLFLWLAVSIYALGASGAQLTQEVIWANYFGRPSLGLVRSTAYFITFGFAAAGPIAMNAVFDITGSYRPAFMVTIGLFAAAALVLTLVRPPKARRYAAAHH